MRSAYSIGLNQIPCVKKNTAPASSTVNYPQAGRPNNRPRFSTLGADPKGTHSGPVTGDFTASRADGLTAGAKIVLRRTSSAEGSGAVGYSIKSADQYNEESTAKTGSLTYAAPSFTDPVLSVGNTRIKAAHINEIRVMVNTIRQYYGLEAIVWNETITAGITKTRNWRDHVTEIRSAINDVISLINSWDSMSSVNRVQVPSWIVLETGRAHLC